MRRRLLLSQGRLPSEYQEVEWIESSAFSYDAPKIHTGVNNSLTLSVEAKIEFNPLTNWTGVYFNDGYWSNYAMIRYYNGSDTSSIWIYNHGVNNNVNVYPENTGILKVDRTGSTFNDIIIATLGGNRVESGELTIGGTSSYAEPVKYMYFKIFDNNLLTRNFIPCYRKSDNVIGMYDLCESTCSLTNSPFYINSGGGSFVKGADVN